MMDCQHGCTSDFADECEFAAEDDDEYRRLCQCACHRQSPSTARTDDGC